MSDSHGNTPAAWTAVVIGLIGFVVGGIGLMISPISYPLLYVGFGLLALGGVVFVVMDKMGMNSAE